MRPGDDGGAKMRMMEGGVGGGRWGGDVTVPGPRDVTG